MEDDIDIYADLPTFETKYNENLDSKNDQDVLCEQLELKKQITELTTKLDNFQKINENLEINIYSLLKTAKAEIARKDKMIDELRKELDDVTFKRGMYSKTNNNIPRKSGFRETLTNMHHKGDNSCPLVKKNDIEIMVADPICDQAGDQQTKPTLIPTTLFGERLLKRMTDKHHMEVKDMHVNRHINVTNSDSCNQNVENYVFESDKENGSIGDSNFCNSRETPSCTRAHCSINEHPNNMAKLTIPKDIVEDFQLNNETEIHSRPQQNTMFATRNCTRRPKRATEVVDKHMSRKRIKSVEGECSSETIRKDACNTGVFANKEDSEVPQYRNFGSSTNSSEMRSRFIKDSGHSRNASVELKKHGYFIRDVKKRKDRYSKDKGDVFREKRDTSERPFKHRDNAVQNSMFALGERNMDNRCIEISKKDNYRVNQSDYRRAKQKEYLRIADHRSRVKATSSVKYREEQYSRNHNSYGSRFEKRYNFRSTDADKTKLLKDASNVRNMTKCSATDETSTDRTTSDAKAHADITNFESRKLKSESGNSYKRQRKRNEYNENVHRHTNVDKSVESLMKYSELRGRSAQCGNYAMTSRNQCVVRETEHTVLEELPNHAKMGVQNSLVEIADSEVLNTNNMQKGNKCEESINDSRCAFTLPDSSSKVDNILTTTPGHSTMTVEQVEESKLLFAVIFQSELTSSNTFSRDQIKSESIESVENVENIEKFIRNCASVNEKASQKISTTLDVIHTLEKSSASASQRADDTMVLLDVCNSEDITDECCQTISNFHGILPSVKRDRQRDQNCNKSTCNGLTLCTSSICVSDGKHEHIETQVEQPEFSEYVKGNLSSNEHETLNSLEVASVQPKKVIEGLSEKHSTFCNETNEERTSYNNMDNQGEKDNMGERPNSKCNEDKNNPNDYSSVAMANSEQGNVNIVKDVVPKKGIDKRVEKEEMRSDEYEDPAHVRSSNKTATDSSKNIQGKIVVFARRKKPVCLANSNANMTILINNESDASVKSSVLKTATTRCNSFLNVIKIGSNDGTRS